MERLPELSGLSHADKDQLIRFLRESLGELREELSELSYIIKVVQSKLVQEGLFGLVNNATYQILRPLEEFQLEDIEDSLRVNVIAPILMIQACLPFLKKGKGSIVNIGSISDKGAGRRYSVYGGTKAFIKAFSRHVCKEIGVDGVRINTVRPGCTDTPAFASLPERDSVTKEEVARTVASIPMEQRLGRPEEIADVVYFVLTGPAYLHGEDVCVDGGFR